MRSMLGTFFSAFTSFFRAFDLGARTLENYAKWAEGESSAFEAESKVERQARISALKKKLQLVDSAEAA